MAEGRKKPATTGKTRPPTTGRNVEGAARPPAKPRKHATPAQIAARDTLIITRRAQGWPWSAVAAEAGGDERTARRAEARMQEHPLPLTSIDPVAEVERILLGYRLSIGDLEAIAVEALREGHHSAAVGAKRGADDARDRVIAVMQATGLLPRDLGDLRHALDARAIATGMLDGLDRLEEQTADVPMPDAAAERVAEAVEELRATFRAMIGLGDVGPPDVEGNAQPAATDDEATVP